MLAAFHVARAAALEVLARLVDALLLEEDLRVVFVGDDVEETCERTVGRTEPVRRAGEAGKHERAVDRRFQARTHDRAPLRIQPIGPRLLRERRAADERARLP